MSSLIDALLSQDTSQGAASSSSPAVHPSSDSGRDIRHGDQNHPSSVSGINQDISSSSNNNNNNNNNGRRNFDGRPSSGIDIAGSDFPSDAMEIDGQPTIRRRRRHQVERVTDTTGEKVREAFETFLEQYVIIFTLCYIYIFIYLLYLLLTAH